MMTDQAITALFAEKGLRPTHQRVQIYRYLLEHPIHPSAETIYNALLSDNPMLSRTTVYNTLKAIGAAGLVRVLAVEENEQRFDANAGVHGHFLCDTCGEIFDFPLTPDTLFALCPPSFRVTDGNVMFHGECPDCQEKEKLLSLPSKF